MAFEQGVSGNPKGRPKGSQNRSTKELRQLIRETVDFQELIQSLHKIAVKENNLHAIKLLLAYGYGTPRTMEELENIETFGIEFGL